MKNLFHISLIILLTVSCSDSNEINYIDFENISNFSISITTPEKKNDFTYHNNGVLGLFYNPDTPIRFEGEIDLNLINPSKPIDPSNIKIKWSSSLDGIISEEVSSDEYKSSFEKIISKNIHTIYFEVSINDNPDITRKDSIVISNVIRLELEPTDRSIKLKWSKYEGSNFESYLIYRENHDPLIEISNINILEYEDFDITLAEVKNFQIVVKTSDNLNIVYGSNIEEGESGKYVKIPYFVTKTIKDRHRNKIYAIVGDDYSADYGLIILDNNSEKVEINSYLLKESRFSDLDISSDGKYLYLCQKWVDKITRLDLNSFEITSFDVSYGGWGIHKIEVGNNYRLYCHRTPPTSGNSSLYILDGTNGNKVGEYYWADHGDIEFNIFNNKLYHSKSVTSNKILIKFSVDNDSFTHDVVFAPDIPFPIIVRRWATFVLGKIST